MPTKRIAAQMERMAIKRITKETARMPTKRITKGTAGMPIKQIAKGTARMASSRSIAGIKHIHRGLPLVWMARIAEELKAKALSLGIEGRHTSWRHMFWWNMLGCLCFGPMIATLRFFRTLNQIEMKLNEN